MPPPRPECELSPQHRAEFIPAPGANLWSQALVGARERSFLTLCCAVFFFSPLPCLQFSCLTYFLLSAVDGSRTVSGGKLRGLHHQQEHRNVLGSIAVQVPPQALYLLMLQAHLNCAIHINIVHFKGASGLNLVRLIWAKVFQITCS